MLPNVLRAVATIAITVLCTAPAAAAEPQYDPASHATLGEPSLSEPEATLSVWNRPIVTFRAAFGARTPERRVALAAERIDDLPHAALSGAVEALRYRPERSAGRW